MQYMFLFPGGIYFKHLILNEIKEKRELTETSVKLSFFICSIKHNTLIVNILEEKLGKLGRGQQGYSR